MIRLFLIFQAFCLVTAVAKPIKARNGSVRSEDSHQTTSSSSISRSAQKKESPTPTPARRAFKIEKAELDLSEPNTNALKISLSHLLPGEPETADLRILCYLYDSDESGNIQLTESKVVTDWISDPIDWSKGQREEFTVRWAAAPAASGKKYAGYTVSIYIKDKLQDSHASSPEFLKKLPSGTKAASEPETESDTPENSLFQTAVAEFQKAEKAYFVNDLEGANTAIQQAISCLATLQDQYSKWQPRIVDYRIAAARLLETKIAGK